MSGGVIAAAWIQGLLQFVPLTAATIVATKGLSGWREQQLGQRRLQLAEQCMASAYEAADAIRFVRGRGYTNVQANPGDRRGLNQAVHAARQERIDRAWTSVQRFGRRYRVAGFYVAFPRDIYAEVWGCLAELIALAEVISQLETFGEANERLGADLLAARTKFLERGTTEDDPIRDKLDGAIKALEGQLFPIMRK